MDKISVNKLVDSIMYQYDRNNNGKIEIDRGRAINDGRSEKYRIEDDSLNSTVKEFSRQDLFKDADKYGIKNKEITRDELFNFISKKFDVDQDGFLSTRDFGGMIKGSALGEYEIFLREYDEVETSSGIKK
ncbi:MAG: hypothetical protein U0457_14835 [Candidatus Sericytochromatia bacterium]